MGMLMCSNPSMAFSQNVKRPKGRTLVACGKRYRILKTQWEKECSNSISNSGGETSPVSQKRQANTPAKAKATKKQKLSEQPVESEDEIDIKKEDTLDDFDPTQDEV